MFERCRSLLADARPAAGGGTDRAWPLYGAAFATSFSLSLVWTAMPFVLTAMGGTKTHVGDAPAVNILAYMVALLVAGSWLGHLDVKRATRLATVAALAAAVLMALAVLGAKTHGRIGSLVWVWLMIAAGGLSGATMALFWPFLMSWVSARHEGLDLNRRLGRYNGSWSSGGIVGPLVGAALVEHDPLWPMFAGALAFVASFLLLGLARRTDGSGRKVDAANRRTEGGSQDVEGRPLIPDFRSPICDVHLQGNAQAAIRNPQSCAPVSVLGQFRWMSRLSLFCAWACFAAVRSQFALQFIALGYSTSQFGIYMMTIALCNFLALIAAGRWAFWHFRVALLVGAQGAMLAAMLILIHGRALSVLFLSAVVLGLAFGFAYSSHLFYGASASSKRSVRMVIHEIVISMGVTAGSWPSGHLAESVGPYAPYWFAAGLVAVATLAQVAIHLASRARPGARRQVSAAPGMELAR
jgi:MFS family permease